ncbi:MAG: patatin-like phospholipase family protein [Rudaea sp.]
MASPTVSLVLGSGGARGYAHIGAIEELLAQGYDIRCIAGSSMGALVGGVYAAGKLDAYRDWVLTLQRFDVLRMLDWTFRGGGLIKGNRIIEKLRELIGDVRIEDLPLSYTAVAVDLRAQREVWFSRGSLFEAIRASIAIPAVFRPHHYQGRTLVDGGLLNPVPVTPTLRDLTDCTIAVDVNAPAQTRSDGGLLHPAAAELTPIDDGSSDPGHESDVAARSSLAQSNAFATELDTNEFVTDEGLANESAPGESAIIELPTIKRSYRQVVADFFGRLKVRRGDKPALSADPGLLEAFALSLDAVQETVTRFKLAAQPPDLLVSIPRTACAFYEFHRAAELVELGRERTRAALRNFEPPRRS